ncbi:MAG: hypothetical protein MUE41_01265 [Gemmatimonadaceae bacterium]|jgi:hypothetical protein|nr:hypothetical protein [Gemmatimonadaceae bacterium]
MPRPRAIHTAAAVDAEIRRLMQERERLVIEEDRQRGALVRAALGGPHGETIRAALVRAIDARDAHLFALGGTAAQRDGAERRGSTVRESSPGRAAVAQAS